METEVGADARALGPAPDIATNAPRLELGEPYTVEAFWRWVGERHRIWYRKEVLKQPPPWSEDAVFRDFHFCNVYRKLDKGTRWYMDHVVAVKQEFPDLLWRTILYRWVNDVSIFERMGGYVATREMRGRMIQNWRAAGIKPFSRAYPLALLKPANINNTLDRLEFLLGQLDAGFDRLVYEIQQAKSLESVSALLQEQYNIGPFLALQMYRDLILARALPFNDDDWVEVGPGAVKALVRMYPEYATDTISMRFRIHELRRDEVQWLHRLGIELPEPVTMGDIEHVLCETHKFWNFKAGKGRKRYYRGI